MRLECQFTQTRPKRPTARWRSDAGPIKKRLCFWIHKCSLIQPQGSGCLILSSSGLNQLASLVALEGIAKKIRNKLFPKHPNCPLSFGKTASPTTMPISISMTQRGFLVDWKLKKFNSGNAFWESYLSIYASIFLSFLCFFPPLNTFKQGFVKPTVFLTFFVFLVENCLYELLMIFFSTYLISNLNYDWKKCNMQCILGKYVFFHPDPQKLIY